MSSKAKVIGTRAETKVCKYLESRGIMATRQALSGSHDRGDIKIHEPNIIIEVKAGQQTIEPSRKLMNEWLRQTVVEGDNAGCDSVLCIVKYRKAIEDAEVWIQEKDCRTMMYLDEFCNRFT